MTSLRLQVREDAYELRLDEEILATLHGGATALLPGGEKPVREADIEAAIERAEDWLMPSSRRLQGLELRIADATGRLKTTLGDDASFTLAQVEAEFSRTHAAAARGQVKNRESVAHIVLLRELAHHGNLSRIVIE